MLDGVCFTFETFSTFIDHHPHVVQLHIGWCRGSLGAPEPDWGTLNPSSLPRLSSFSITNIDQNKVMPLLIGRPLNSLRGFCLRSVAEGQAEVVDSWNVPRFCNTLAASKAAIRRLNFKVWNSFLLDLPRLANAVGSTLVLLSLDFTTTAPEEVSN
jgi:hypothetical protein